MYLKALLISGFFSLSAYGANPSAVMDTSLGSIEIELLEDKSPKTVENFISYVNEGTYNGTIFHRVIKNFIAQGGYYDAQLSPRKVKAPIVNEAFNGLKNKRGTLAMSRKLGRDSATSQFFINLNDNPSLDYKDATDQGSGYCVFAKIKKGMSILNKLGSRDTKRVGVFPTLPVRNILIKSIRIKR